MTEKISTAKTEYWILTFYALRRGVMRIYIYHYHHHLISHRARRIYHFSRINTCTKRHCIYTQLTERKQQQCAFRDSHHNEYQNMAGEPFISLRISIRISIRRCACPWIRYRNNNVINNFETFESKCARWRAITNIARARRGIMPIIKSFLWTEYRARIRRRTISLWTYHLSHQNIIITVNIEYHIIVYNEIYLYHHGIYHQYQCE